MDKIAIYKEEIYKKAGIFTNKKVIEGTAKQLKKRIANLETKNKVLKFGNKAWKAVGQAGALTGAGGVGYGLYQKKKSENNSPNYNMYQ